MKKILSNRLFRTCALLLLLLISYSLFRICFYWFNRELFGDITTAALAGIFFNGLRYDVSTILMMNAVFIFSSLLPVNTIKYSWYDKLLKWLFIIPNSIAFLFEISDWMYYAFNHKRSTADVLHTISRKGDFLLLLPSFLKSYWYLFLIAIIALTVFIKTTSIIFKKYDTAYEHRAATFHYNNKFYLTNAVLIILVAGLSLIGIRGGLQLKPIGIRNAIEVTDAQHTALVLNTPFSIIKTFGKGTISARQFMPYSAALKYVNPVKQYASSGFKSKNVVVLVLESFSKEYTRLGGGVSYTPFLDSLMGEGMVCTQAYANGLHSVDGIPAILSGIPALMEDPFIMSVYGNNKINSVASLLKQKGYTTAFFHGATNGSWGFDVYAKSAGFSAYYGRTEYNNDEDYDGSWGIFDLPFLQYVSQTVSTLKQPFCVCEFTLSSHGPYTIPREFKNHFPKGTLPPHETTGYADFALRKFFEAARRQPWYNNTLFVISADHCSPSANTVYYRSRAGRYQIPIIYFDPGNPALKGVNPTLTQQIDILPSVMQYLGFDKPFFALGNSIFDTAAHNRCIINQTNGAYEMIFGNSLSIYFNNKLQYAYRYPDDSLQKKNLMPAFSSTAGGKSALHLWQAFVQTFDKAVVNNQMYVREQ